MDTLSKDSFYEICSYLPNADILALLSSSKQFYSYKESVEKLLYERANNFEKILWLIKNQPETEIVYSEYKSIGNILISEYCPKKRIYF